jgi:hypothetical protein
LPSTQGTGTAISDGTQRESRQLKISKIKKEPPALTEKNKRLNRFQHIYTYWQTPNLRQFAYDEISKMLDEAMGSNLGSTFIEFGKYIPVARLADHYLQVLQAIHADGLLDGNFTHSEILSKLKEFGVNVEPKNKIHERVLRRKMASLGYSFRNSKP